MSNVPLVYYSTCMARAQFSLSQEAEILGFPVFNSMFLILLTYQSTKASLAREFPCWPGLL